MKRSSFRSARMQGDSRRAAVCGLTGVAKGGEDDMGLSAPSPLGWERPINASGMPIGEDTW